MRFLNRRIILLAIALVVADFLSFSAEAQRAPMDAPDKLILPGLLREERFNSPLGITQLRWVRSVETTLGKNPLRATVDGSRAASQVLRLSSVPTELQNWTAEWNIVFMDEVPAEAGLPANLVSQCHPGWMIPPSNIYIVGARLSTGCSSQKLNQSEIEARLSQVVIHEIAHAIEHRMLGDVQGLDHARAEGFASWFELLAARQSSLLDETSLKREKMQAARLHMERFPGKFVFDGSMYAYARMSIYFAWLEHRYGLSEIFRIYADLKKDPKPFVDLVASRYMSGSVERLDKEVLRFIESQK